MLTIFHIQINIITKLNIMSQMYEFFTKNIHVEAKKLSFMSSNQIYQEPIT